MSDFKSHGITEATSKNIVLGAGTLHKGLKYTEGTGWNATESIIAATSGGNKLAITPEITPIEVDGALVAVKDLDYKTSETATLEVNVVEFTPDVMKLMTISEQKTNGEVKGFTELASKDRVEPGDYIEDFGFVGKTREGKPVIVIFDWAICTSGIEWDAKAKEAGVLAATFECRADIEGSLESLPWHIYFPEDAAAAKAAPAKAGKAKTE